MMEEETCKQSKAQQAGEEVGGGPPVCRSSAWTQEEEP